MSIATPTLVVLFIVAVVPLVPTEPVLVGMGVLAATAHGSLTAVIAVAALGCAMSDHLLFLIGRITGARALSWLRRKPSAATAADWLDRHAARWGAPILVAGRWLPGGGTIGMVLAGSLRWRFSRLTPMSVLGSALWSTYAALLGYLGGSVTGGQPVAGMALSFAVAVLVGLAGSIVLHRTPRRSARPQDQSSTEQPQQLAASPPITQ